MDKSFSADTQANHAKIAKYVHELFRPEDSLLAEIRKRSEGEGLPAIHVGQMDGLHLEVLARMSGARKIVEIGTLAGYSGVCLARGMGPQGKLYTFEFEPKHAEVARQTFARAGVSGQIEMFVGPALDNLSKIEGHGPFDLVFIDADKVSYPNYLAWAADHLRVGGVVLGDNTFAWGGIADDRFDDAEEEASVRALQEFNRQAAQGGRFRSTILPTGEGLTVAVKIR
jgi:caffeoyl-CoA O-methyltransferase